MRKTNVFNAKNQETSHNTALTSDVMNVINTDILSWTALTEYTLEYPLQEHHKAHRNYNTRSSSRTIGKTEKEETGPDHSLDTADIIASAIMTCTEVIPDHNNWTGSVAIEAAQDNPILHTEDTVTDPTMTHHTSLTTNPPHTAAHLATTLRTGADYIHAHPTNHQSILHTKEDHTVWDHTPIREPENHT